MSEIVVGMVAQLAIGALVGSAALGTDQSWIKFLASTGAILLTFLAGAELDPPCSDRALSAASRRCSGWRTGSSRKRSTRC